MEDSSLQLLELQVDALFTYDSAGHIVAVNEPDGEPAPRFFLGRSRAGNLWRVRHDLPLATVQRLEALAAGEPVTDDLQREPRNLAAFLEALDLDSTSSVIEAGPAYCFPDSLPETFRVTQITRANLHLLQRMGWNVDALARVFERREPVIAVIEDGVAVSVCFSSRLTALAAEAGVETLEAHRGRGYAPRAVAAWARAVRASNRVPLYSTSWDNHASQAVARKLGLTVYAADFSLG